jgi:hypothetical protein
MEKLHAFENRCKTSVCRLTAEETNYIEWSPSTLHKRQEKMAKRASAVWRTDL